MAQAAMDGVVLPLAPENAPQDASCSSSPPSSCRDGGKSRETCCNKREMQQLTCQLREKLAVNGVYAQNGLTLNANEVHSTACCQCSPPPPFLSLQHSSTNRTFLEEGTGKEDAEEEEEEEGVQYVAYESELQMGDIMRLIQKDLSEPYSIYTYRYFIHNWPKLCFLAMADNKCVGAVVCKLDVHKKLVRRGYIAMLAVDKKYRKRKIGSNLVLKAIRAMVADDADEVVLETEITNKPALRLYENLGFVRDKRLFRYYLNGVDALRLKLWLR